MLSFFCTLTEDGEYILTGAGYTALIIVMLLLLVLACFITKADQRFKVGTKRLVFAAMAMALAFITSNIKIFQLPMGGSITLFSMLFLTLIGTWYGTWTGLLAAIAYGFLQMIVDPYIISFPQMLCDYVLAFGALGISGLFSGQKYDVIKGYVAGCIGRFVFSFLSGYIFFGMYAPEGMNPALYSALYNGSYIAAEMAFTIVVMLIPAVKNGLQRVRTFAVQE